MAPSASSDARTQFLRQTLRTIVVALLIDILAFTIILPLFPRLIAHYEAKDGANPNSFYFAAAKGVRAFREWIGGTGSRLDIILFGGFLGSLFSFLQFFSSPIIGKLSDRYGRRTVLLVSMAGNALSMLLWIFSESFSIFVLSRIVGGLTEGNVQMSIAMISDITTSADRSRALAWVGISFALGFTVGPPLGAYLTTFDLHEWMPMLPVNRYSSPALFAFVLILVETLYMYIYLPETTRLPDHLRAKEPSSSDKKSFKNEQEPLIDYDHAFDAKKDANNLRSRKPAKNASKSAPLSQNASKDAEWRLFGLSLVHFLFLFSFSGMEFTLTFLTHDRFGFTHAQQGRLLGFMGIFSALIQGGYVRRVSHRYVSEQTLVLQGILSCSVGLAVIGLRAVDMTWLYVGAAFLAFTSGTVVNSLTSLASMTTKSHQPSQEASESEDAGRGHALGKFRAMGQLGRSIGPLFACSGYWILGSTQAYLFASVFLAVLAFGVRVFVPPPLTLPEPNAVQTKSGSGNRQKKE